MLLAISNYGSSLSIKDGAFFVQNKSGSRMVSVEKVKTIMLHTGCRVTTDALATALQNSIDVVLTDRRGNQLGRIWDSRFGSISTIRKNQLEFCKSHFAVALIKNILSQKLNNQCALLLSIASAQEREEKLILVAIREIEKHTEKIQHIATTESIKNVAGKFRGYEGSASKVYWQCISKFLPLEYQFRQRTQHPAQDIFNAMLNYSYGMLYSIVENKLIEAGIDPSIGILHMDNYHKPVFVYDIIEKYRVWVDFVVCHLCFQNAMHHDYFDIENGEVLIGHQGRTILIQAMRDYLDETIVINGLERSRETQILHYCRQLAAAFKDYPNINLKKYNL